MMKLFVIVLACGLFVGCSEKSEPVAEKTVPIVLNVEGMTCESCVQSITSKVAELPAVRRVDVSLDTHQATVYATEADDATRASIAAAINKLGFTATLLDEK